MPDVVIWLLSGTKRIAHFRIPAYDVLYSPQSDACGQYCGRVFNMFMKGGLQHRLPLVHLKGLE